MSTDKVRPLVKAVAGLPIVYTGLVLDAVNQLRGNNAEVFAAKLEEALVFVRQRRMKFLADRYEALPSELKAKLLFENNRPYFNVQGAALMSESWEERLKKGGHTLSGEATDILSRPDYNKNHRLEAEKTYKLGLFFGEEIVEDSERTTANLQAHISHEVGVQVNSSLKAELALLIREKFSDTELKAMGFFSIAVLHQTIIDSNGRPRILCVSRHGGSTVKTYQDDLSSLWMSNEVFASLVS